MHAATVQCCHGSFGGSWIIVINEAVVETFALDRKYHISMVEIVVLFLCVKEDDTHAGMGFRALGPIIMSWWWRKEMRLTAPIFLSGIILTLVTCPVVSKIWRRISSVTLGSSPPTYKARLFGSGAARRTTPPAEAGVSRPAEFIPGDDTDVGRGFVFCGITTGGSGGGGI